MGMIVRSVTNFGRSGLSDWLVQRMSAVVLAAYTLFMASIFVQNPDLTFSEWQAFFDVT